MSAAGRLYGRNCGSGQVAVRKFDMRVASRIYAHDIVQNSSRKFGADELYVQAYYYRYGQWVPLLLTFEQINTAMERAKANPEDIKPRRRWWQFWS
jgi:hypothetical protein